MLSVAAGAAGALALSLPTFVMLLRAMERSVGLAPPIPSQVAAESADACALFRHLPALRLRLAWRSLGAVRTPVHSCGFMNGRSFLVKREDLASPAYGGNKVRTLQHTLAVLEARRERAVAEGGAARGMLVVGSGGSNQVVATAVHAARLGLPPPDVAWLSPDEPDLDNSLNMLSALSLPLGGRVTAWGASASGTLTLAASLLGLLPKLARGEVVFPIGANTAAGVLGQVGAMLELAEQVAAGECADPGRVYLPVGSACTLSGLVLGVALARRLDLPAFRASEFELVGVPIHHLFAAAERTLRLHTAAPFSAVPLTVGHTVREGAAALAQLGGPDVTAEALAVLETEVRFVTRPDLVGLYGAHSAVSKAAAAEFDAGARVVDGAGEAAPTPWMCGHFCAKALAALLEELDATGAPAAPSLLWQTKSLVQPRGERDEWEALAAMPSSVRRWAAEGEAQSALRPGSIPAEGAAPDGYRHLMTRVETSPITH